MPLAVYREGDGKSRAATPHHGGKWQLLSRPAFRFGRCRTISRVVDLEYSLMVRSSHAGTIGLLALVDLMGCP